MSILVNPVPNAAPPTSAKPPLCVDLDNSLVATDLLWESLLAAFKQSPIIIFLVPLWLMRGRAYLKARLAKRVALRPDMLPYREEVVRYLRQEREVGRRLWLVTACDTLLANQVSLHLDIFDRVLSSNGTRNLKGTAKAQVLEQELGHRGFSYLGDSHSDMAIWAKAASAVVVSRSASLARQAALVTDLEKHFPIPGARLRDVLRALRLHHWSKNVLLFLPMLLAHKMELHLFLREVIAFVFFGLAASSVYVLNDLLDLQSDRQHPWKAARPFAAGSLPISTGMMLFLLLSLGSILGGGLVLGPIASVLLLGYCTLSIAYSLKFKRMALADVFVLASFYSFRIVTGGFLAPVHLSVWFMAFSGLFFFSLAVAKRYSELVQAKELVLSGNSGRAYRVDDRALLSELGVGSAFAAIVIFCTYTQSPDVLALYPHPSFLLMVAPLLLFWTARMWLRAHRGELDDDPVVLALKDPVSYCIGFGVALLIAMGTRR